MLPEKLRLYRSALVERQKGNADEAKLIFQNLDGHPIYKRMASSAAERFKTEGEDVKRFLAILEMNGNWEPYAFCDLMTRAYEGELNVAEKRTVCELQLDEFNSLFAYCYEGVTGKNVVMHESESVTGEIAA